MKLLIVLFLSCLGCVAMAAEPVAETAQVTVEPYRYGQHLDIARVLAVSPVPTVCEVVPMQLTYEDSKGDRHIMEYRVIGNGCSNN